MLEYSLDYLASVGKDALVVQRTGEVRLIKPSSRSEESDESPCFPERRRRIKKVYEVNTLAEFTPASRR